MNATLTSATALGHRFADTDPIPSDGYARAVLAYANESAAPCAERTSPADAATGVAGSDRSALSCMDRGRRMPRRDTVPLPDHLIGERRGHRASCGYVG
ncbi:hypothetical protein [Microbacterium sp. UBA3394]|uniref:hypothetical protein n=1 Tax=Microbacterium sp. UBA3394 TaxID=1946945 RepID=UPI00257FD870|nr:hypothetical protein [Microbacterium sp. UBA3394]